MCNVVVMNRKNNTYLKGGLDHPEQVTQFTQAHSMFIPRRKTIRGPILQMIAAVMNVAIDDIELLTL